MTPLYCPHCRRPVEGELEHGVCPTGWVREPADKPLVEVAPHVWSDSRLAVANSSVSLEMAKGMRPSAPKTKEEEVRDAINQQQSELWRVYSSREEDFGEPLTPRRLAWSLWKWRLAAAGVGAMFAILILVAANAI